MQEIPPKTWVNGKTESHISVNDRGLMYGQSVFETIAINQQQALLLEPHLERLEKGCNTLAIKPDWARIKSEIDTAIKHVNDKAVLRISVTMGEGGRGYKNPSSGAATRIISLHDYPSYPAWFYQDGIELGVADIRLADQPQLAGIKHSNRLEQIIARSQWQDNWQEALLLDHHDNVIEATQSNLFIVKDGLIKTPDLSSAGVAGVMREFILLTAQEVGVNCQIVPLSIADIEMAEEVFVSNSIIGLWPIKRFQQTSFSNFEISQKLLTIMQDHGAIPNI